MRLDQLKQETLEGWITQTSIAAQQSNILLVCVSGYEARASHWARQMVQALGVKSSLSLCAFGFADRKSDGARRSNDKFFAELGSKVIDFHSDDEREICADLRRQITTMQKSASPPTVEVHIDYSSMPRRWYCALFRGALCQLRKSDKLFMWYSGGVYDGEEIPTAGVSDFSLFSGQPTITPKVRTHIFGLGFDRIRASAIFRVIDPQSLVCFYGEPGVRHEYVERVRRDNRDLLAAARYEFSVPVNDFPEAFSKIADITREFARLGDVILIPDGPKPLVLASSLIPEFFARPGITSLHVRRRRDPDSPGLDVKPSGSIYGFSVSGSKA